MKIEPADMDAIRPLLIEIIREAVADATPRPAAENELRVYTEAQAAELLQLKTHNLREARKAGKIAYTRTVGRRIAYSRQDVESFLQRERVEVRN